MAKVKYYYDTKTLSYKRIELSGLNKLKRLFYFLIGGTFTGLIMAIFFFQFFDSPKEKMLNREVNILTSEYKIVENKLNEVEIKVNDIQNRDDNIYRVIFEMEPIPKSIRKAGYGGVNRYQYLKGHSNSELIINTNKKIDQISKQLDIQSKSYDTIIKLARNKADMLASLPAIQPISNKDLSHMASGYGYRIHPIYKTRKLHTGMDFSAKSGTPIYATGDGEISEVKKSGRGYGNHVIIDHGYGYKTLYGHMKKYIVHKGQKVKRGEVIGYVGSTGASVGPHVHYEVHKDGKKINPVDFFYNDLTPDEYEKILEIASQNNQSFD